MELHDDHGACWEGLNGVATLAVETAVLQTTRRP